MKNEAQESNVIYFQWNEKKRSEKMKIIILDNTKSVNEMLFMFMIQSTHRSINGYALLVHMDEYVYKKYIFQSVTYVHLMLMYNAKLNMCNRTKDLPFPLNTMQSHESICSTAHSTARRNMHPKKKATATAAIHIFKQHKMFGSDFIR